MRPELLSYIMQLLLRMFADEGTMYALMGYGSVVSCGQYGAREPGSKVQGLGFWSDSLIPTLEPRGSIGNGTSKATPSGICNFGLICSARAYVQEWTRKDESVGIS